MKNESLSRREIAVQHYLNGETLQQVGKRLGVTKSRIHQYLTERTDFREIQRLNRLARQQKKGEA